MVEVEQDPAKAPPAEYAGIGHYTLVAVLQRAGHIREEGRKL